jgi:glucose/arabinose dehydrogenase
MHNPIALLLTTLLFLGLSSPAAGQLRAELVADGFLRPVAIVADPLAPGRLFVAEQRGIVWVLEGSTKLPTPFIDLSAEVQTNVPPGEQGFLGLVVHPAGDPVFVSFSKRRTPEEDVGDTVVRRYRRSIQSPVELNPATAKDLVWPDGQSLIRQTTNVHYGGDMHFLPDGRNYLYIGLGDGGAFDAPVGGAQDPQSLRGKMLRIDVNVPDDHPRGYVVPSDNPFVDGQPVAALPEIWAFGYRNPWRWSFDDVGPGRTGAMIVGDVGEKMREEINYEPYDRSGRNYGWFVREGTVPTPGVRPVEPAYGPLTPPTVEYGRDTGDAVTGGYIYRGESLSSFYQGRYFLADFGGHVWSLGLSIAPDGEARVTDYIVHNVELGLPRLISTFGRDSAGELYFATFGGGQGGSARVLKIVPAVLPPANLASQVHGSTVQLTWQPPQLTGGFVVGYRLEAGSQPGAADLATVDLPWSDVVVTEVPDGRYYVRVRTIGLSGVSAPSNEIEVRVGCTAPPPGPAGLSAEVGAGGLVSVVWDSVTGATSYVLEAGFAPGLVDAGVFPVTGTALAGVVPAGTYYVRVRAVSSCGTGPTSEEIVVTVPTS